MSDLKHPMPRRWLALTVQWGLLLVGVYGGLPAVQGKSGASNLELARQLNRAFVEVAERVSPAVVVINVVQTVQHGQEDEDGNYESLPPGFWRDFHQQFNRPEKVSGQGSGIILREDGYILTNGHVVEDAENITVRLKDGRIFKATVRGIDTLSDVAVIKIEARGLPVARLADSAKTRVGEIAIAIGAPFGLDNSVTFGHVSAKSRTDVMEGLESMLMDQDFLQTDALINPGNSGGPLVNIEGEVIGMNTLIRGLHTGIGFAIPSNFAREVADQLIARGKYDRAWLGIKIRALRGDEDLRQMFTGIDDGVVVSEVRPDGPSAKSEIKPGDVITAVDGTRISSTQELRVGIRKKIGQPVTLDVYRKGKTIQVKVSPAEMPTSPTVLKTSNHAAPKSAPANLGITVKALTAELAAQLSVDASVGVVVATVEKNSPAERKDIKPGDLITQIDQQDVLTPKQFQEALRRSDLTRGVLVNLISGKIARFEVLKPE